MSNSRTFPGFPVGSPPWMRVVLWNIAAADRALTRQFQLGAGKSRHLWRCQWITTTTNRHRDCQLNAVYIQQLTANSLMTRGKSQWHPGEYRTTVDSKQLDDTWEIPVTPRGIPIQQLTANTSTTTTAMSPQLADTVTDFLSQRGPGVDTCVASFGNIPEKMKHFVYSGRKTLQ